MNCPQCGGALPEGASLCPECGAPSLEARTTHSAQGFEAEISVMLAQANLSRLRGRWDLATAQCVEVLRRYPNNASAHSLLGDICRDQGQYADAVGWYRLALQLDPTSSADHEKLADAIARLSGQRPPAGDQKRAGRRRLRVPLGLVLGVGIGVVVLTILAALSVSRSEVRSAVSSGVNMPRVVTPAAEPGQPARESSRPAPSPPGVAQISSLPREPVVYTPGSTPSPPPAALDYTSRGHRIMTCVAQAADSERLMIAVDSVTVDPRSETAEIEIAARDVSAGPQSRRDVLEKALRAADLVLMCDDKIARVTVRCKVPLQGPTGIQEEQLCFVGDISAADLRQAAGRDLTFDQALALCHPYWWHERMRAHP